MSEHEWVQENLDAYVAGGLSADERSRTEQHAAGCGECAQALAQARKLETTMANLFADAHPDAKLEERMVRGLAKARLPFRWSTWTRFAAGVAAAVMLGVVGMIVQAVASGGGFGFGEPEAFDKLKSALTRRGEDLEGYPRTPQGFSEPRGKYGKAREAAFEVVDADAAAVGFDADIQERIAELSVPGATESKVTVLHDASESMKVSDEKKPLVADLNIPIRNSTFNFKKQKSVDTNAAALYGNTSYSTGGDMVDPANLATASESGPPILADFDSPSLAIVGGRAKRLEAAAQLENRDETKVATKKKAFDLGEFNSGATMNSQSDSIRVLKLSKGITEHNLHADNTYYSLPAEPTKTPPPPPADGRPRPGDGEGETPDGGPPPPSKVDALKKESPPEKKPSDVVFQEKGKPPAQADSGLKIIRTGQMEFEVDSFDKAVKVIESLIKPLLPKGGFILTSNSEKQANGKTRGSVVVRMRPEHLDEFVLDLRRDLGKMGDLRMQHIGSQDVTKQFTDTESELKAARAVEKRLLGIIENSKGDVKDFVAAEKELGLWRTKIEKMEGELRYYANQVALSTLTIRLVEKEISAAAALVVSSTVKTRIEVDNVTKARETAEKAVEEFKGRIVKSDEKQLPAGQVEAILHAEIPPAKKDAFRKVLESLGIVSSHEDTQTQTTVGGSGPVLTPRRTVNNVLFQVTLNNIVNIRPKHAVKLDVVTADVRGNFEKLKDEINRVHHGQIREARLDENQDKQKAVAVIEFNVPTAKKEQVDKLIASFGPTLDRANTQADIKEVSTDQKFGYSLKLYSIANVAAREKTTVHVEVKNVEKKAGEIIDIVKAAKGHVDRPKSGLNKAGKTEALLVISAPLSASDALVTEIKEKGKVVDWVQTPNPSVPENELATAQIVVLLSGPNPLIPLDEGFGTYVSRSLYLSFTVFATCLLFIFTGLSFILPWAAVIVIGVWIYRRFVRAKPAVASAAPEPPKAG